jgi:hypothetical protein
MSISIADISSSIWINELGQSPLITVPEIAYWVRTKGIGSLNSLIFKSFTINESTLEINEDFTIDELAILAQIYLVKFYQTQANNFLGALGIDDIIEYDSDGTVIRRLNRNEQSKTFLQLKSQAQEQLNNLLGSYKINRATPRDVSGIDTLQIIDNTPRFNRIIHE